MKQEISWIYSIQALVVLWVKGQVIHSSDYTAMRFFIVTKQRVRVFICHKSIRTWDIPP